MTSFVMFLSRLAATEFVASLYNRLCKCVQTEYWWECLQRRDLYLHDGILTYIIVAQAYIVEDITVAIIGNFFVYV